MKRLIQISAWMLGSLGLCAMIGAVWWSQRMPTKDRATRSASMAMLIDAGQDIKADIARVVRPAMSRTQFIAADQKTVQVLSSGDKAAQTQWLNQLIANSTEIDAVALFNSAGKISAINTVYASGQPIPAERVNRILGMNFDQRQIIQGCLQNNSNSSVLEFQTHCDITPAFFDSSGLSIAYSVPVIDPQTGDKIGVVSSRMKFDRLTALVDHRIVAGGAAKVFYVSDGGTYYSESINGGKAAPPIPVEELRTLVQPLTADTADYSVSQRGNTFASIFPLRDFHTLQGGAINVLILADGAWLVSDLQQHRLIEGACAALIGTLMVALAIMVYAAQAGANSRRQVEHARVLAESASRAKSAFLANMSHEIRTPMTAIVGYADMMLEPDQTASDRQDCLQVIRRNGGHLLELINDILDLSKIEANKITIERIDVDLPQLVSDVASMMRSRAEAKGLNFDVEFHGPIARRVRTDPLRLKQILVNLLGNAIKFTSNGRVKLDVRCVLGSGAKNGRLRFDVSDTGIGITEDQVRQLFQPFKQADESTTRKFGGTGLGLTISKRLAVLLGGDITVQSTSGVGSVFSVEIDGGFNKDSDMLPQVTESLIQTNPSTVQAKSIKLQGSILFAEDGLDNQRLISTHLRKAGAEVTIAPNGKIAVELMSKVQFDLVLMDMQMPVLDGYAATSKLRQKGFKQPIIALTAHAMAEDRAKCMSAGCTDFLTKPIEKEKLIETVASYLKHETTPLDAAPAMPKSQPSQTGHRSEFANDPEMKDLIEGYVQRLPVEVAKMKTLLQTGDAESLRQIAHQLKGSGGGYGFAQLTDLAASIDHSIKQGIALENLRGQVDMLVDYMRKIYGYDIAMEALNAAKSSGD